MARVTQRENKETPLRVSHPRRGVQVGREKPHAECNSPLTPLELTLAHGVMKRFIAASYIDQLDSDRIQKRIVSHLKDQIGKRRSRVGA